MHSQPKPWKQVHLQDLWAIIAHKKTILCNVLQTVIRHVPPNPVHEAQPLVQPSTEAFDLGLQHMSCQ